MSGEQAATVNVWQTVCPVVPVVCANLCGTATQTGKRACVCEPNGSVWCGACNQCVVVNHPNQPEPHPHVRRMANWCNAQTVTVIRTVCVRVWCNQCIRNFRRQNPATVSNEPCAHAVRMRKGVCGCVRVNSMRGVRW